MINVRIDTDLYRKFKAALVFAGKVDKTPARYVEELIKREYENLTKDIFNKGDKND